MKRNVLSLFGIAWLLLACNSHPTEEKWQEMDVCQYVNPLIGTDGHGHTHPAAQAPSGMVQLGPSQYLRGWDWTSGYHYSDSVLLGFSHKHLSGTGIGDLGDILMQPTTGTINLSMGTPENPMAGYGSTFSHDNETVEPAYYQVKLDRYGINVELTATERVGVHRYTFPKNSKSHLLIDLVYGIGWDHPTEGFVEILNDTTLVGYRMSTGWANDQRQYFAMVFQKPFEQAHVYENQIEKKEKKAKHQSVHAVLDFKTENQEEILVKVGLSSVSGENALENIRVEVPHWSFEKVKENTREKWNNALNKIKIEASQKGVKEIFYTGLYHTLQAPTIASDVNGQYLGSDKKIHQVKEGNSYTLFSLWDTYRALHPLYTISQQEKVSNLVRSLLEQYEQTGLLPVWQLEKDETNTMIGYHAVPVIVDAYFKGFEMNETLAYQAVKASAMQDRKDLNLLDQMGFIPADSVQESVALILEYAIDDWAIAQMAKKMGKEDDYKYFSKRAKNFIHVFDSTTGFFRGKLADGTWRTPFDPRRSEHRRDDYCEGNAWQYLWLVPQHPYTLIELLGGEESFLKKLDQLFEQESLITGEESPDISGLIGQYAHGNEPGHHTSYLYSYAGKPWKTQHRVRNIMTTQYRNDPDGYAGNEDCGQMSAWYVLNALGIYPVNPTSSIYVFGSPIVDYAKLELEEGSFFEIVVKDNSESNVYIKSVYLNEQLLDRNYLTHKEIMKGGQLKFYMGDQPNKNWGSLPEHRPVEELMKDINL